MEAGRASVRGDAGARLRHTSDSRGRRTISPDKDPEGFYHVISKDTGFDPLIAHLKTRGLYAQRSSAICEIPILGFIAPKTIDERVDAVIKNLESRGNARPRRVKTLASTIHALFLKKLEQSEVDSLVAALEMRGKIAVTHGKVAYTF